MTWSPGEVVVATDGPSESCVNVEMEASWPPDVAIGDGCKMPDEGDVSIDSTGDGNDCIDAVDDVVDAYRKLVWPDSMVRVGPDYYSPSVSRASCSVSENSNPRNTPESPG